MKIALRIASILTWVNLIFWGFMNVCAFLFAFALGFSAIAGAVLMSAIPLNAYAALQLHKSIRRPDVKLSSQTPVGIRFVGFVAMFLGVMIIGQGVITLQNAKEAQKALQASMPPGFENYALTDGQVSELGIICIILGLFVVVSIFLNSRLLRWYYLVKQSDVDGESDAS